MVLSYASNGDVILKTKSESVMLGSEVRIGSFVVPGPGEYDIAGIQCEAKPLTQSFASFIRAEDLTITYLNPVEPEITKLNDASAAHILIADIRSDDQADTLKAIVKAIEPSYVVLRGTGATTDFVTALGITPAEGIPLKLTRTGLPPEGTFLVTPA
jgi:hypothetical protein